VDTAVRRDGQIQHLGYTVVVESACAEILDGLGHFYRPYYRLTARDPGTPDVTVVCVVREAPGRSGLPVTDMRVYRRRPEHHTATGTGGVFRRTRPDLEIEVDDAAGQVTVTGSTAREVELQARVLLRDQILQRIERSYGTVIFHGAAAARDGGAVLVLGDRNSGKTTALLTLMGRLGYDFVTADRASVRAPDAGTPIVSGVPARANIHAVNFEPGQALDGLRHGVDWDAEVEGKVLVDADALATHLGVGVTPSAPLRTAVLPRLTPPGAPVRHAARTDPAAVAALLRRHVLEGAGPDNTHPAWLGWRPRIVRRPDAVDTLLARIAERCRIVEFTGPRPAYVAWLRETFG
jgi:hypothetical protein